MNFKTFGPFEINLDEYGNIPNSMTAFWDAVELNHSGLPAARGCYLFGIRASGGPRIEPWYIGKTNYQTFDSECFKPHQRNHYSRALNFFQKRTPFLYLISQMTENGRFYKGQAPTCIDFLETYLIGFGLRANRELLNKRDTKLYREIVMPGFLNSGKGNPGDPANDLRATLMFSGGQS
jgi:hypothetical protein